LPMYDLPKLPTSLEEAVARMKESPLLAEYFTFSELLPNH
jgi:hypothetical protein